MPAALNVDWIAVEKAAIAGMSYAQLAIAFDVPEPAIRKRASRYAWPTPKTIVSQAVSQMAEKQRNQAVTAQVVTTAQDTHARTAMALVNASASALADFAAKPAPVTDWQDAATAYRVQRLAAGIDKEGSEVRVNVAMFTELTQPQDPEPEAWDAESTPS